MSTFDILQQLQDKLLKSYKTVKVEATEEELEEMFGPGFTISSYLDRGDGDIEDPESVDAPYVTHRPFALPRGTKRGNILPVGEAEEVEKDVKEKEVTTKQAEPEPTNVPAEPSEPNISSTDMNAGDMGGVGGMDNMGDMSAMAGMEEEEEKTATELGRLYELKKIYARLTSIESYLGNESDQNLLQIRNCVSKSIELFEIVSSNFNSYKDKLDEIIVMYYKFLMEVYNSVKSFYNKQKQLGDK